MSGIPRTRLRMKQLKLFPPGSLPGGRNPGRRPARHPMRAPPELRCLKPAVHLERPQP